MDHQRNESATFIALLIVFLLIPTLFIGATSQQTSLSKFWNILPIIGTVVFGLSTLILSVATYSYKKKADLVTRRFEIYHKALENLDKLNKRLSEMFAQLMLSDITEGFHKMIKEPNPDNWAEYAMEMQNKVYQRITDSMGVVSQMYGEFNNLRLVASPELLILLDRYRELTEKHLALDNKVLDIARSIKLLEPQSQVLDRIEQSGLAEEMAKYSQELNELHAEIEKQMRKDLS